MQYEEDVDMFSNFKSVGELPGMKSHTLREYLNAKGTEVGFLPGTDEMVNQGPVMEI